jgi:hypothetical protein
MSDKKKKIAAITAVANYIKSEQEAMAFSQAQVSDFPDPITATSEPAPPVNLWGISGRQQQMQMRSMMQMKAFHRLK